MQEAEGTNRESRGFHFQKSQLLDDCRGRLKQIDETIEAWSADGGKEKFKNFFIRQYKEKFYCISNIMDLQGYPTQSDISQLQDCVSSMRELEADRRINRKT